jgi:hypothetical protein
MGVIGTPSCLLSNKHKVTRLTNFDNNLEMVHGGQNEKLQITSGKKVF